MAKSDSLKREPIPPPGQELEFYQQLSDAEWRACKDFWAREVNGFMPNGKAMSRDTYRYLFDFFQYMGNGTGDSDFPRGRYQFASKRTAPRLGLGGRSEKSQTSIISEARREARDYGFIRELRRGSGGNGYPNKGSVLVMAFDFLNHTDHESLPGNQGEGVPENPVDPLPEKPVDPLPENQGEGVPEKPVPYLTTGANTGSVTGQQLVADGSATCSQESVDARGGSQSRWPPFPEPEPSPFDGLGAGAASKVPQFYDPGAKRDSSFGVW